MSDFIVIPSLPRDEWWAGKDLHLRRREPPDLQSGPVDYFGTDPWQKPGECMGFMWTIQYSPIERRGPLFAYLVDSEQIL